MNTCPLCNRILTETNSDKHHLIPKTFKGKETVTIHKICHQKIHSTLTERELLQYYNTIDRLLEHEEIKKFVIWVKKKDPEFYSSHRDTVTRSGKRKRH